jgi:hypothetical protein
MSWRDKGRNKAIGRGPRRTEASFGFWLREMSDLGEGRSKMLGGFASYAFLSLRGLRIMENLGMVGICGRGVQAT